MSHEKNSSGAAAHLDMDLNFPFAVLAVLFSVLNFNVNF